MFELRNNTPYLVAKLTKEELQTIVIEHLISKAREQGYNPDTTDIRFAYKQAMGAEVILFLNPTNDIIPSKGQ
jgi:hypothetical protein